MALIPKKTGKKTRLNAERKQLGLLMLIKGYWLEHLRVFKVTVHKLARTPLDTLMTCAAIAIALALPVGFYLFLNNIQSLGPNWQGHAQISAFLVKGTPEGKAKRFLADLKLWPEINQIHYISEEEALEEFQALSGVDNLLIDLKQNPLPIVLEIEPARKYQSSESAKKLLVKLEKEPLVHMAQLDLAWVERLNVMITIGQRIALGMIIFLSAGVLLVVGNTIRLEIESRRAEIDVAQLVGATDAFVRRPFLYTGIIYGLGGGLIAMVILSLALLFLSEPVASLTSLYSLDKSLLTLSFSDTSSLLFMAVLLGFVGAWLSVNRHLDKLSRVDRY